MASVDRIARLQDRMAEQGLICILLLYSRDILYYTGTAQPACLVVWPDDYRLFVRSGLEFALNEVWIPRERVEEERRLEKVLQKALSRTGKARGLIGTQLDILTAEQFDPLRKSFEGFAFVNVSPAVLDQRKKKDPGEIGKIRRACAVIHKGHEAALASLREGVTELELAAAVENAHRLAGHEGIFFIRQPDFFMGRGPLASGDNLFKNSGVVYTITGVGLSPAVPAGPSRRIISEGETVIVDIPVLVEGYHADQTRTYCLGPAPVTIKTMYDDLQTLADHLIARIRAGMTCRDIYRMALEKAETLGRADVFQSFGRGRRSRLIGHGIGLELNEPPIPSEFDRAIVDDDYVIALDLHMLVESVGVVKLEDLIHIRPGGNEILTVSPRRLFEV